MRYTLLIYCSISYTLVAYEDGLTLSQAKRLEEYYSQRRTLIPEIDGYVVLLV
jgi:hypothetical protein